MNRYGIRFPHHPQDNGSASTFRDAMFYGYKNAEGEYDDEFQIVTADESGNTKVIYTVGLV